MATDDAAASTASIVSCSRRGVATIFGQARGSSTSSGAIATTPVGEHAMAIAAAIIAPA